MPWLTDPFKHRFGKPFQLKGKYNKAQSLVPFEKETFYEFVDVWEKILRHPLVGDVFKYKKLSDLSAIPSALATMRLEDQKDLLNLFLEKLETNDEVIISNFSTEFMDNVYIIRGIIIN